MMGHTVARGGRQLVTVGSVVSLSFLEAEEQYMMRAPERERVMGTH